jgi:hypothetical protein
MQKFECEEKAMAPTNDQLTVCGSHHFASGKEEVLCCVVRACVTNDENLTMEQALRKPVESRRAYKQRRKAIAFGMIVALTGGRGDGHFACGLPRGELTIEASVGPSWQKWEKLIFPSSE